MPVRSTASAIGAKDTLRTSIRRRTTPLTSARVVASTTAAAQRCSPVPPPGHHHAVRARPPTESRSAAQNAAVSASSGRSARPGRHRAAEPRSARPAPAHPASPDGQEQRPGRGWRTRGRVTGRAGNEGVSHDATLSSAHLRTDHRPGRQAGQCRGDGSRRPFGAHRAAGLAGRTVLGVAAGRAGADGRHHQHLVPRAVPGVRRRALRLRDDHHPRAGRRATRRPWR